MTRAFWFKNQDRGSVRDFILAALAKGQDVWSGQDGFCAADDPSEIEGDWKLLSSQEALDCIPADNAGNGWSIDFMEADDFSNTRPYFMYGGNTQNWLWYAPATEEWLSDSDGNNYDPSRYMRIGPAADFIEEQARGVQAYRNRAATEWFAEEVAACVEAGMGRSDIYARLWDIERGNEYAADAEWGELCDAVDFVWESRSLEERNRAIVEAKRLYVDKPQEAV